MVRHAAWPGYVLACLLGLIACTPGGPAPAAPGQAVTVATFGPAAPANAPGQSLYLVRYQIAPGTALRPHHHEGTQIGLVAAGELTYHVLAGEVPVYRTDADGKPVLDRTLTPGTIATVTAGEWVVEESSDHHWGANEGTVPLVIYTSSLFREGAPLATPDPSEKWARPDCL